MTIPVLFWLFGNIDGFYDLKVSVGDRVTIEKSVGSWLAGLTSLNI